MCLVMMNLRHYEMSKGTGPVDMGLKLGRNLSWTINEHLDGPG